MRGYGTIDRIDIVLPLARSIADRERLAIVMDQRERGRQPRPQRRAPRVLARRDPGREASEGAALSLSSLSGIAPPSGASIVRALSRWKRPRFTRDELQNERPADMGGPFRALRRIPRRQLTSSDRKMHGYALWFRPRLDGAGWRDQRTTSSSGPAIISSATLSV